jgi:hypothetical protein
VVRWSSCAAPECTAMADKPKNTPLRLFARLAQQLTPGIQAAMKASQDVAKKGGSLKPSDSEKQLLAQVSRMLGETPDPSRDEPPMSATAAREVPQEPQAPQTPEALLIAEQERREAAGEPLLDRKTAHRLLASRFGWKEAIATQRAFWKARGLNRAGRRPRNRNTKPGNSDQKSEQ